MHARCCWRRLHAYFHICLQSQPLTVHHVVLKRYDASVRACSMHVDMLHCHMLLSTFILMLSGCHRYVHEACKPVRPQPSIVCRRRTRRACAHWRSSGGHAPTWCEHHCLHNAPLGGKWQPWWQRQMPQHADALCCSRCGGRSRSAWTFIRVRAQQMPQVV